MILALSVHSFVDKIGAYVGFAAAIGLALFAMLLFAQARELKRMREWGAHAHDRIGELERRLAAALELARRASTSQRTMPPGGVAQRPVPARPAPAAAARPAPAAARTSSPTRLPLLPAAPARVGGAALGSATVFVPLPKVPPGAAPAQPPAAAPASAPAPAPAARPAAVPAAMPAAAVAAASASAAPAPATPAPATAAGQGPAQPAPVPPAPAPATPAPSPAPPAATNGHSDTFPPVPPVRRPAPRPGARPAGARRPPARPGQRPAAAAAPLRARSTPSATPRGNGGGAVEAPHGRRRLALLLGGLGVVAVVAIAFLLLSGGGSDSPSLPAASSTAPAQQTTGAARQTTPATAAPAHDRVTVAVLNGTTTAGLASRVASDLTGAGFVQGPVTNASDQQRSVTVVSYFGGHEAEAKEVAKTLNVPADAVQPIDADTEASCAQGATCAATVVVTVGADRQ